MAYLLAESVDEALDALAGGAQRRAVAGGTDVYPGLGDRLPDWDMVDLSRIPECRGVTREPYGWRIGAATTWSEIIDVPLPPAFDGLKTAAAEVGSVQVRNAGTVAGNICNASPAADGMPPLLTLNAEAELAGPDGRRILPLREFVLGPRRTELAPGEIMVAIRAPELEPESRGAFLKLGARKHLVISIAMVAAVIRSERGRVAEARVAVGACSPVALRMSAVESALEGLDREGVGELNIDASLLGPLRPISDARGGAGYRLEAVAVLIRRATLDAMAGREK